MKALIPERPYLMVKPCKSDTLWEGTWTMPGSVRQKVKVFFFRSQASEVSEMISLKMSVKFAISVFMCEK